MVEQTLTASGQLDMAHLNAGILVNKPILESSLETWQRVIDVSLNGVFLGIRGCAPHIVTHVKGSIVVTGLRVGNFGQ
jgi:NAD(P)-dependent dehydrogenase (short-subunit alcohol dehydrogenase family)